MKILILTALLALAARSDGAISFGPSNTTGVQDFVTQPAAVDWSTVSIGSSSGTYATIAQVDGGVQTLAATAVTAQLGAETVPGADAGARYSGSGATGLIYTAPTGVGATILMATLQNDSGSSVNAITITYDYARAGSTVAEQVEGHRVYHSLTGLANSWIPVNALSGIAATQTGLTTTVTLSTAWADNTKLYLLWADDNSSPNTDNAFSIDNFSVAEGINVGNPVNTTLIPAGVDWKYLDDGSDQGSAWTAIDYDDDNGDWGNGPAELGYGNSPATTVSYGPDSNNKHITTYFRHTIDIANPSTINSLEMSIVRDDGAVIYLNGTEIGRSNMAAGTVLYNTLAPSPAVGGSDESTFFPVTFSIDPVPLLVAGTNVLAVEIHQESVTSSDISFNLELIAEVIPIGNPPTASITAPAGGASFTEPATVNITADAGDTDGTVSKVEFYQNAVKLGEDTTDPYEFTATALASGNHNLSVRATDNDGNVTTSAAVPVSVIAGASGTLTRGPYLNMANQNSIVVRWRTSQLIVGRVRYGLTPEDLNQFTDESGAETDHVVRLTGLTPYTRYYYSVGSATDTLTPQLAETTSFSPGAPAPPAADYTFRTSPLPGTAADTRIWVVGDCGRGTQAQADGRDAYYNFTASRTPDLNLQLGDNAYNNGADPEYQSGYFNMYHNIFRRMPQWSTLGNHDANNGDTNPASNHPYFDMFTFPAAGECGGVPSGTEHYYSFDYGNIHFICLDSQASITTVDDPGTGPNEDGAMAAWLRQDLASTTSTWIIAFWHHPAYSKGSHNSDTETQMLNMRVRFNPIMEEGGVDLVFSGHSHNYERSVLLDGHYGTSGTITAAMKKDSGNGSVTGFTTSANGKIRNAANGFTATSTVNGTFVPADGAYIKPLTGPRDHFGAVYNTAGMSGLADGGTLDHTAMYISYNQVGTVNLDINGNTLTATFIQADGSQPDNFTIIKQGEADRDGDHIPDAYEDANGLDRSNSADGGTTDSDGDGVSNLYEYILGQAANVPDTYDWTTSTDPLTGDINVSLPTLTGRTYRVLYSHTLLDWKNGSPLITGDGTTKDWTDDGSDTGTAPGVTPRRFYRVEASTVDP